MILILCHGLLIQLHMTVHLERRPVNGLSVVAHKTCTFVLMCNSAYTLFFFFKVENSPYQFTLSPRLFLVNWNVRKFIQIMSIANITRNGSKLNASEICGFLFYNWSITPELPEHFLNNVRCEERKICCGSTLFLVQSIFPSKEN